MRNHMLSEARLKIFWIWTLKKQHIKEIICQAKWGKKSREKLNRAQKCSILGLQNIGSRGGARAPGGPPPGSAPVHSIRPVSTAHGMVTKTVYRTLPGSLSCLSKTGLCAGLSRGESRKSIVHRWHSTEWSGVHPSFKTLKLWNLGRASPIV